MKHHTLKAVLSDQDKALVSSLLKKKGEVKACSNCGGLDLTIPPTSIDVSIGMESLTAGSYYCRDCGFEGIPTVFDDKNAYENFFLYRREKYNKGEDQLTSSNIASGAIRKERK